MDNSSVLVLKTSAINLSLEWFFWDWVHILQVATGPGFNSIPPANGSRYIKHTMIKPYLLAGLQLIKSMNSFIDLQHWQALQATLTLLIILLSHCKPNTPELASPVCQQDIYKASHMRIKFTVVPNYYAIKLSHTCIFQTSLCTQHWQVKRRKY